MLAFFLFPMVWLAPAACGDDIFPQLNRENLLENFSSSIGSGQSVQQAFSALADFVLEEAPLGTKFCLNNSQECFEVAGVNISLNWTEGGAGQPTLIRQVGESGDFPVHHIVNFTYDRQEIKGGVSVQQIYDLVASIGLKTSPPQELALSADRTNLRIGETANLEAVLRCGESPMKNKEISFELRGPGELAYVNASTGSGAVAKNVYTATKEGKAKVNAYYHDRDFGIIKNSIDLEIGQPASWEGSLKYFWIVDCPAQKGLHSRDLQVSITITDIKLYPTEEAEADTPEELKRINEFKGSGKAGYAYHKIEDLPEDWKETHEGSGTSSAEVGLAYSRSKDQNLLKNIGISFSDVKIKINWTRYDYGLEKTTGGSFEFPYFSAHVYGEASALYSLEDTDPDPDIIRAEKTYEGPYSLGGEKGGKQKLKVNINFRKVK